MSALCHPQSAYTAHSALLCIEYLDQCFADWILRFWGFNCVQKWLPHMWSTRIHFPASRIIANKRKSMLHHLNEHTAAHFIKFSGKRKSRNGFPWSKANAKFWTIGQVVQSDKVHQRTIVSGVSSKKKSFPVVHLFKIFKDFEKTKDIRSCFRKCCLDSAHTHLDSDAAQSG